jgi:hypothetical protein
MPPNQGLEASVPQMVCSFPTLRVSSLRWNRASVLKITGMNWWGLPMTEPYCLSVLVDCISVIGCKPMAFLSAHNSQNSRDAA